MTADNKVLIIGGGPAGLVLAHSCKTNGIPYEIFERDATYDSRSQGGSMMLHLALRHLRKNVTYPHAFDHYAEKVAVIRERPNLIAFTFFDGLTDETLHSMHFEEPNVGNRVNRGRLRDWLIEGLDEEAIHFGKKFSHYESDQDSVTAHFSDGTSAVGSVIVGADGSLSSVCAQLVGGKEKFNEITKINPVLIYFISTWITDDEWLLLEKYSDCTGRGAGKYKDGTTLNVFFTVSDTDLTRTDGRHKEVVFNLSRYIELEEHPTFESNAECLSTLNEWVADSFPEGSAFPHLFSTFNDETHVMKITVRERTPSVELMGTDNRVFIVGDAAHCMTMFRGEGGNHAMIDACNLGTELGKYHSGEKSLEEAHDAYFEEMVSRGSEAVRISHGAAMQVHKNREAMIQTLKDMVKKGYEAAEAAQKDQEAQKA
ncbi:FAD/NAD(P)-binding domain-containing protein [Backusella circina FSU 941]|nr:FAD/NAD(P)-binding domain-containing protein [Backusella circina FSU 941]